jgi:3-hydroxyacyl-[acyl-carrier-protein] dehydratase
MRFLFVDRILRLEPGREVVVRKNVSNSEDFFGDHFAGRPVMPGCLILETGDQAARLPLASAGGFTTLPSLTGVVQGKFQHLVQPGDTLEVRAVVAAETPETAEVRVEASVEGRRVAQAGLTYVFRQASADPGTARACARLRAFYEMLTTDPLATARARAAVTPVDREGGRA